MGTRVGQGKGHIVADLPGFPHNPQTDIRATEIAVVATAFAMFYAGARLIVRGAFHLLNREV